MPNPYETVPPHQLWSKTMARKGHFLFDPITSPKLTLTTEDKIATMGSCFAQHLTKELIKNKFNVLSTDGSLSWPQGERGLFSANYGNVYTVAQALQLMEASVGRREFSSAAWRDSDGQLRDPLRPSVPRGKFNILADLLASRRLLLDATRRLIEEHTCFVFTLGLTEAWVRREDGAVLPSAPGVVAGEYSETEYEFVNFSYVEVLEQMHQLISLVREFNSQSRFIITVSPVPLAATYENRHVAISTMASKAILRAVADEIVRHYSFIEYFPSFEIFYTPGIGGEYFELDLRHVRSCGVQHAMRLFKRHYCEVGHNTPQTERVCDATTIAHAYDDIICDEDFI